MKLWEIKAQALRLMFTDSDLQFNEQEFIVESGNSVINSNANTREKYIRMGDSINRAIDMFFDYCGNLRKRVDVKLVEYVVDGDGAEILNPSTSDIELYGPLKFKNYLNLTNITDMLKPHRVDLKENYESRILGQKNLDFYYDVDDGKIYITNLRTTNMFENFEFTLYYEKTRSYLSGMESDIAFDMDILGLPSDVQRQIPFYIKGELFEEDEPTIANMAMNNYIRFLSTRKKNISTVQTKVTRAKVFNKQ